jgi:NADPH:quinone reductase-like Zn-dependent oxidoreductase
LRLYKESCKRLTRQNVHRHTVNLVSGRPQDGAFALFTTLPANKAAILPDHIPYTEGVVIPMALEAAVCALSLKQPGTALPGVATPALKLPYPSLAPEPLNKILIVYGGSSSAGSMTIQLATAAGIDVLSIASGRNFGLSKDAGAVQFFDYQDPSFPQKVIDAVVASGKDFVGIFDAVSTPETYSNGLAILAKLGGGHLACVHPPPPDVPENVQAGMIFAVNDIATPVWRDFVTPALREDKLKCLPPPTIAGNGLESIQEALKKCNAGVHATKLVVRL